MKFLILFCVLMTSACGMQGDLYLPEDETVSDKSVQDSADKNGAK